MFLGVTTYSGLSFYQSIEIPKKFADVSIFEKIQNFDIFLKRIELIIWEKLPHLILAKFQRFEKKEQVQPSAVKLKGKIITAGISEQFPKEINVKIKELWPVYKRAKLNGHETVVMWINLTLMGLFTSQRLKMRAWTIKTLT